MATTTSRLGLTKPAANDPVSIDQLNANFDKLDAAIGDAICTSTTRPSSPFTGQKIYETDTGLEYVYSGSWILVSSMPTGFIAPYAGVSTNLPVGWLLCDGGTFSGATYPKLATLVGNTFGTSSGGSYYLPDFRGRVAVGTGTVTDQNSRTKAFNLADKSGEIDHKLTTAEMPSHTHSDAGHAHPIDMSNSGYQGGIAYAAFFGNGESHPNYSSGEIVKTSYANIQATGGDGYHNNIQPYLAINYLIKA